MLPNGRRLDARQPARFGGGRAAVLAAILAFFFNVDLDTLVGLVSVSLACWYASAYPTR
jgi:hypothetical protein